MDDSVIIELFRSRSEEAIKEAQKKYGDYCFHIAFEIIRNREDAEECVNDAMLRAWSRYLRMNLSILELIWAG